MPVFTFTIPDAVSLTSDSMSWSELLSGIRLKDPNEELFICQSGESLQIFAVSEKPELFEVQILQQLRKHLKQSPKNENRLDGPKAVRCFFEWFVGSVGQIKPVRQNFRKCFEAGRQMNLIGPRFNWLYQRGVWLSEKVRIELNVHKNAVTPERVIADLAEKIFGSLQNRSSVVLAKTNGCEKWVQKLRDRNIGEIIFPDSKNGSLREVCERCQGKLISQDRLHKILLTTDLILIFDDDLLNRNRIRHIMGERKNAPLLWASLSEQSHASQEDLSNLSNFYYYTLNDLRDIIASNLKEQKKITSLIAQLIEIEVENFVNWVRANEQYRFGNIIAKSDSMQKILELIARIAQTDTSVLIDGESGTGKELVAKAIHEQSRRAKEPFVVVNCGAVPETLLESELFGHVRGAFTGATASKKGLFEIANHGTIFLDEIGETSQATQVKLLRFLQNGEIKPVGSNQNLNLDVRVISATNRDLEKMVPDGEFRQDLYYRLNVIKITVPPLRNRKEDILPLAEYFLTKYSKKINKTVLGMTEKAKRILCQNDWHGNVRELENAIERAVALSTDDLISEPDLLVTTGTGPKNNMNGESAGNFTLKDLERQHIAHTLQQHNWNYDLVAKILGIGRTTLWRKMKEYDISNS